MMKVALLVVFLYNPAFCLLITNINEPEPTTARTIKPTIELMVAEIIIPKAIEATKEPPAQYIYRPLNILKTSGLCKPLYNL